MNKDSTELKEFIKNSLAKSEFNPIIIDADNFDACYLRWCIKVLPSIDLKSEVWKKARKQNIALEQDFFLADLISKDDITLNENLRILLQKRQDDELYYKIKTEKSALFDGQFNILEINFSDKNAHHNFWKLYERPPAEKFWREIFERRDKITPQDIMERKGAFFTPPIWVKKAQNYLEKALGKEWQEEYYIWDCAAGMGNLLKGLTNSAHIYASTLDLSDVLIMKDLCEFDRNDTSKKTEEKLNLLENHIFQFDFLNDDFSKLPKALQEILNDEKKRKKLIIFINPPYAEAGSAKTQRGTGEHKAQVAKETKIYDEYQPLISSACNELFAQFFIRIYKEIPNCILASFSTPKYLNFIKFRQEFKAKFLKGFIVPAHTFDNVDSDFPIGFLIWDLSKHEKMKKVSLELCGAEFKGVKNYFACENKANYITAWLQQ